MDVVTPLRELIGRDVRICQDGADDIAATVAGVAAELYLTLPADVRLQVELLDGSECTLVTDGDLRVVTDFPSDPALFARPLWEACVGEPMTDGERQPERLGEQLDVLRFGGPPSRLLVELVDERDVDLAAGEHRQSPVGVRLGHLELDVR